MNIQEMKSLLRATEGGVGDPVQAVRARCEKMIEEFTRTGNDNPHLRVALVGMIIEIIGILETEILIWNDEFEQRHPNQTSRRGQVSYPKRR